METDIDQIIKATQCYKTPKSLPEKNTSQRLVLRSERCSSSSPELRFKQSKTKQQQQKSYKLLL